MRSEDGASEDGLSDDRLSDDRRERLAAATRFSDVRWFAEIDSTNRYLLHESRSARARPVVAVADFQTSGRGRMGRSWTAPPESSLLVSVLLWPDRLGAGTDGYHLLVSATGLAARAACDAVAGVAPGLKWPNDLVVGGRKLAGILAESEGTALVVGIGLNVNWPPDFPAELTGVAVALNQLAGRDVDRVELLVHLLEALELRLVQLSSDTEGRRRLMDDYRAASATLGQAVRVELAGGGSVTGTATAIDDDGRLVVSPEGGGGAVVVTAGDVVHLRSR